MFRAIFEFVLMLLFAWVARAVLGSLMKGFGAAASGGFQQQNQRPSGTGGADQQKETPRSGELHKDPVCGTYVSEATSFRRLLSGKLFTTVPTPAVRNTRSKKINSRRLPKI